MSVANHLPYPRKIELFWRLIGANQRGFLYRYPSGIALGKRSDKMPLEKCPARTGL